MTSAFPPEGFRMPAEWVPQQAIWMLWPYRSDNWREQGVPAQKVFAEVAAAILQTTPVFMGVPAAQLALARTVMPAAVTLVEMETDDAWARDTGATIVVNADGERAAIDWHFNAWGGHAGGLYAHWDKDDRVAGQMAAYHAFPSFKAPIVMEGGALHVDGEGTLLVTRECLLARNRNPELDEKSLEKVLNAWLGTRKVIWLPEGVYNDETDGHIDNLCCFVRPGEVALLWTDDRNDPQYARSQAALKVLENEQDAAGRPLKVWKLPMPGPLYSEADEIDGLETGDALPRQAGERLAASYVNYLITNQQIVYPMLDTVTDAQARDIFAQMYPDYRLTGVPSREILLGGGNIHCITQQVPISL